MKDDKFHFPFYPDKWDRDADLLRCSWAAEGMWARLALCMAWEMPEEGVFIGSNGVPFTKEEILQALPKKLAGKRKVFDELVNNNVLRFDKERGCYYCEKVRKDAPVVNAIVENKRKRNERFRTKQREADDGKQDDLETSGKTTSGQKRDAQRKGKESKVKNNTPLKEDVLVGDRAPDPTDAPSTHPPRNNNQKSLIIQEAKKIETRLCSSVLDCFGPWRIAFDQNPKSPVYLNGAIKAVEDGIRLKKDPKFVSKALDILFTAADAGYDWAVQQIYDIATQPGWIAASQDGVNWRLDEAVNTNGMGREKFNEMRKGDK